MEMQLDLNKLLTQRKNRAWTQAHLAEVCGLSLRTIQRVEKSGSASHDTIQALAAIFEISVEDLIYKESEIKQNSIENVKQHLFDKLISRLGLFLIMIVPAIWFFTFVTGTNLTLDVTNFTNDPSFFHTERVLYETQVRTYTPKKQSNAVKGGKRTVTSNSTIILLFSNSNITYYTYLPAVIFFCISIGVFANRRKWVQNCLIISSVVFIVTSSKLSLFVFPPFLLLFYLLMRLAHNNHWKISHS